MAGKHDSYVFKDGLKYKVRPAVAFGEPGKFFKMRNLTNETLKVKFPADLMEEPTGEIPPRERKKFRVREDADGLYEYEVRIVRKGIDKLAQGESGPFIIIDP